MQSYGLMVRNGARVNAYADALRAAVTPGCTVLDIGAGFGFFSILACKFGAGRVIAVEPAESIGLGAELARANGCSDRITFVQGLSSDLGEESRADVIVADLRSVLPLYQKHIPVIADARDRLLVPGGTLITQRDTLRWALVSDDEIARMVFDPWQVNTFDLDLLAGSRFSVNSPIRVKAEPDALLSDPLVLATIDYRSATDPNLSGYATHHAKRSATAHGLVVWFEAELAGGYGFSNAPGEPMFIYNQLFYPFERPINLAKGDIAEVTMDFQLAGYDYATSWKTRFARARAPDLRFAQSTALCDFVTPADLRRRSGGYVPQSNARLELDRYCLSRFDGETPQATIAREAMERAPERFSTEAEALGYVAALAERYHEPRR